MDYQCRCFRLFDRNSELPHRVDRTLTVLARKETSYDAGTIGHSGKQNGAVRHALVTRHPDLCLNLWRPENVKLRHKEVLTRYPIAILLRCVEQSLQIFRIAPHQKRYSPIDQISERDKVIRESARV